MTGPAATGSSLSGPVGATGRAQLLLTAAEAYPALERAFLAAQTEISASFLVFDPDTLLRSPEAQAVGRRWFDLIVHTLRRGVTIRIRISDFDPIARGQMHRATWRSLRLLLAAAEVAGPGAAALDARAARHPASTGWLARLMILPLIAVRVQAACRWLNGLPAASRAAALRDMPGLRAVTVARADGRRRPALWPVPKLFPGTHHQKIAVFDRQRLYVGGLDLNERRYDDHSHQQAAAQTWHDMQMLLDGPVAADAARHLSRFEAVTAGAAPPEPTGALHVTLSTRRRAAPLRFGPQPLVTGLFDAHCRAIAQAKGLIYLESQYFRDPLLTLALCRAARARRDLSLILILPGAPEELAFEGRDGLESQLGEWYQARALRRLQQAFGARLFLGGPAQRRRARARAPFGRDTLSQAPLIYVHAKLSAFDHALILSSANLNGRSMRWDTEAGVKLTDPAVIGPMRRRAMAHWLPRGAGEAFFADATAVAAWRGLALSNAARRPEDRQGFILPYDLRAAERFGTPIPFLPAEMV